MLTLLSTTLPQYATQQKRHPKKKKPFLALLQENANTFKQFMAAQSSLFMKACSYYLDDLSEEDAKAILDDDTYGFGSSYLLEPDKYTSKVQKAVTAYKNAQKYTQLKKQSI